MLSIDLQASQDIYKHQKVSESMQKSLRSMRSVLERHAISGEGATGVPARPGGDFPNMAPGRPSVSQSLSETSEDECAGSQRLLHRFTHFLMFINVLRSMEID